jgi:hypothetical protein
MSPRPATLTGSPLPLRPVEYRCGRTVAFGPARAEHDWMRRAACARPEVDPDLFIAEETDTQAIQRAKAVCRAGCPVFADCRAWAEQANEFGVYAAETYSQRTARLRRHLEEAG